MTVETHITADKYQLWLEIILSGQMADGDVIRLLRENPKFEKWYRLKRGLSKRDRCKDQ